MMEQFNAKVVEEFGHKAYRKGFFKKWQEKTSSLHQDEDLTYDEAAELAYNQLKLQGSE